MNTTLNIETPFPLNWSEARALWQIMKLAKQHRSYRPSTMVWSGDPSVQAGDVLKAIAPNGEEITHVVTSQAMHFGGGFNIESTCTGGNA